MGFFILIGLCLTVLGGSCLAVKPLNQKHEIKPFRTFDDFLFNADKKGRCREQSPFLFLLRQYD
ncbi:hypothetical protein S101444_01573 [Bacillus subtilis subsp. subtilis]|nr:hypothetical protein S101444_01573 [Bacillus subtilis subsp. subtilis]